MGQNNYQPPDRGRPRRLQDGGTRAKGEDKGSSVPNPGDPDEQPRPKS